MLVHLSLLFLYIQDPNGAGTSTFFFSKMGSDYGLY